MRKVKENLLRSKKQVCLLSQYGIPHECGPLEPHHPLIYARKQIDEYFVLICRWAHWPINEKKYRPLYEYEILRLNLDEITLKYPKFRWGQRFVFDASTCKERGWI